MRKYKRKEGARKYKSYDEETLNKCLEQIKAKEITQRQAAIKYGIARRTIANKLKGKHCKKVGGQIVFSPEEESTFVACCMSMFDRGFPVTKDDLIHIVAGYLKNMKRQIKIFKQGYYPGENWLAGFLNRHKTLALRFAEEKKKKKKDLLPETIDMHVEQKMIEGPSASEIYDVDAAFLPDDNGQKKAPKSVNTLSATQTTKVPRPRKRKPMKNVKGPLASQTVNTDTELLSPGSGQHKSLQNDKELTALQTCNTDTFLPHPSGLKEPFPCVNGPSSSKIYNNNTAFFPAPKEPKSYNIDTAFYSGQKEQLQGTDAASRMYNMEAAFWPTQPHIRLV